MGVPNAVVLCVDRTENGCISGRLWHAYSRVPMLFRSIDEAFVGMERLYDDLHFPHPGNNPRTFDRRYRDAGSGQEKVKLMKDEELWNMQGDLGTFIIRVQHRQNGSWQGRITWMEEDKTICFRSVWEMIRLIAGALDTVSGPEDDLMNLHWPMDKS